MDLELARADPAPEKWCLIRCFSTAKRSHCLALAISVVFSFYNFALFFVGIPGVRCDGDRLMSSSSAPIETKDCKGRSGDDYPIAECKQPTPVAYFDMSKLFSQMDLGSESQPRTHPQGRAPIAGVNLETGNQSSMHPHAVMASDYSRNWGRAGAIGQYNYLAGNSANLTQTTHFGGCAVPDFLFADSDASVPQAAQRSSYAHVFYPSHTGFNPCGRTIYAPPGAADLFKYPVVQTRVIEGDCDTIRLDRFQKGFTYVRGLVSRRLDKECSFESFDLLNHIGLKNLDIRHSGLCDDLEGFFKGFWAECSVHINNGYLDRKHCHKVGQISEYWMSGRDNNRVRCKSKLLLGGLQRVYHNVDGGRAWPNKLSADLSADSEFLRGSGPFLDHPIRRNFLFAAPIHAYCSWCKLRSLFICLGRSLELCQNGTNLNMTHSNRYKVKVKILAALTPPCATEPVLANTTLDRRTPLMNGLRWSPRHIGYVRNSNDMDISYLDGSFRLSPGTSVQKSGEVEFRMRFSFQTKFIDIL